MGINFKHFLYCNIWMMEHFTISEEENQGFWTCNLQKDSLNTMDDDEEKWWRATCEYEENWLRDNGVFQTEILWPY